MDEKRRYFRIKNDGQIEAKNELGTIKIIELSNSGAVIEKNPALTRTGKFDLKIYSYITTINYEVLRDEEQTSVLKFTNTEEKESLFYALKQIRDKKRSGS